MIELQESAKAFEALGHEVRFAILRQWITAGPGGIHAGAIGAPNGYLPDCPAPVAPLPAGCAPPAPRPRLA